jgi:methylglyoxal synthase
MNIAIIAHDKKKELMVQFCIAYCGILSRHNLCGTGTTAKLVSEATGLEVKRFLSGPQGGDQQIGARIAYDVHNVPIATNSATAEVLVRGLERGDLDWRDIVNPKTSQLR